MRPAGLQLRIDPIKRTHWKAVGYLALTSACFATLDTLTKSTGSFAPVTQSIWMRYAVQAVMMSLWWAVWLRPQLGLTFFRPRHPRFHLLGGALMLSCTVLSFLGLRHMPVGEFTAVQF